MSHFELFRCDGIDDISPPPGTLTSGSGSALTPASFTTTAPGGRWQRRCSSFLEVADTFPTIVLEKLLAADWLTVHTVGKGDRHYCPLHYREVAV